MAVDEARRSRAYESMAAAIGRDEAVTIFELLPPPEVDLATRGDLRVLEERFVAMEQRFDERFRAVDQRFAAVDRRLDAMDETLRDIRGDLRGLRSNVTHAIAGQTRALVLGVLTATVSIGGLSVVFAQLFG
ncbi:MAG: hypothetical protein WD010_11060 [Nitriliruptor sp.]|uniref:hypothetical protein n=1 Tax=Nitriliruptor sp. TaxID=2448056 RepID=UPI00349FFF7F